MPILAFAGRDDIQSDLDRWKVKKSRGYKGVNLLLEGSRQQWWEDKDIRVAFNLSRISSRLERLMGTNVVRVTDRNYMTELRKRIAEDYRNTIAQKIRDREIKELQREQILILDGKTDQIPEELANDPIFLVNKRAAAEIAKRRSKLKTNREKNAERLQARGEKWERERLLHEEREEARLHEQEKIRKEQKALELKYKEQDAKLGLNLLRIHDENWRSCEEDLRDFLENERNSMKARSRRIPTAYSSDPLDLLNIRRREGSPQKRRGKLERIKFECVNAGQEGQEPSTVQVVKKKKKVPAVSEPIIFVDDAWDHDETDGAQDAYRSSASETSADRMAVVPFSKMKDDVVNTTKLSNRLDHSLDKDVSHGLLVSSDTYSHLRYADPLLVQLRETKDIHEIYKLAEIIILGRRTDLDDEMGEEENLEEEDAD